MPPGWVSCWPWRTIWVNLPLQVGMRFVALSAAVPDLACNQDYRDRMSPREKQQKRLVVNLQEFIAGEKLRVDYQLSAGIIALSAQINEINALRDRPSCPSLLLLFARAGLPVLGVTSGVAGEICLQLKVSAHFCQVTVRYQSQRDNLLWLNRHLLLATGAPHPRQPDPAAAAAARSYRHRADQRRGEK